MTEGNLVVFKGTADGIVVLLDNIADFEEVLENFKEKLSETKQFFRGSRINIRFKGRTLDEEQQEQLMSVLTNQEAVDVAFVHQFEGEEKAKEAWSWVRQQQEGIEGSMTHFHYGIVRSGTHIHYEGNVVVIGDVNPGGLVSAGGNIIILGALKGRVRAGLNNELNNPFIVSLIMTPIQIGIGHIIAQPPQGEALEEEITKGAQIAYLKNEQIYVDQIDTKTLNHMLK